MKEPEPPEEKRRPRVRKLATARARDRETGRCLPGRRRRGELLAGLVKVESPGQRRREIDLRQQRRDATAEIEHLTNLFTVNETYFYREVDQFSCLVDGILPELIAKRR